MVKDLPKSISELHKDLREKKHSCVELVETYLSRIEEKDKKLNSFITVSRDSAYEEAKNADRVIADNPNAFEEFPLLGVVVGHKDIFLTKGIRTTAASNVLKDYISPYSGTVVERLKSAGAITIGKLNCDAWAHGSSGENSDFGTTKNPWNKAFTPGGSSSGSAVSVASDFSLIATGTDTGGSIRLPASFCNVVGFKPTYGSVSRYGVISMASSLDSVGHFTHCIEDTRKVLQVTKGVDGKDATLRDYDLVKPKGKIRLGIPKEYLAKGLNKEVEKAVKDVLEVYKKEKIEVKEVSLPNTQSALAVYYIVQPAEVSSNLARFDGVRFGEDRSSFSDEAKRRIMLGSYVLSSGYYDAYYLKAMKVRSEIIEDFEKAFKEVDAIVAPISPTPPFKLGEKTSDPLEMYLSDIFAIAANLAGIPGVSVPAGFSSKGLPIGFQILGPRFSEETLFTLGEIYQSKTDWHLKKPEL